MSVSDARGTGTTGTLTIYRTYFLESEIVDGDYINAPSTRTERERTPGLHAAEIAHLIEREGLSFEATGTDWADDPDGSYVTDYVTGERCEVSAHLNTGYPSRLLAAIVRKVG